MALDHSSHTARAESRHWITVFTLHVQSHGIGSLFLHCTCRVTALDHCTCRVMALDHSSQFTLHVQSHGIGSQFSHCTCRVMALDHCSHTARAESRHWITALTLHVQSHGIGSLFPFCTCKVTALHRVFHFKHLGNSTPNTSSFFG